MPRKPPKTGGNKMSAEATKWLGYDRTCIECGDTKTISEQTFALSNKHKGGWHEVCRVCQGVDTSGKSNVEVRPKAPKKITAPTQELIDDMYLEALKPRPDMDKLQDLVATLDDMVRRLDDRESFMLFVDIVKPLIAGWQQPGAIHEDIIDGLLSGGRRRLIIATRYSAKSTLTSIWLAWRIFKNPLIKIMCISRGSKLAARMLRTVRQVYFANCPMLAHLIPDDSCLDNAEQFQVPQATKVTTGGATFTSLGIGSNLPGFRADLTVGDDVEGPQEDTPEKVEDLLEILNELHMINPKGEKVMLGTYQSEFSIYAKMADLEDREGVPVWENHRACMFEECTESGEIRSRWPGMFSDDDAMDWRKSVTERAWRLHAMLIADPSILNERPLKISQFITVNWPVGKDTFPEKVEAGGDPLTDLRSWGAPKGDVWYGPGLLQGQPIQYVRTICGIDPASGLAGRDAIGLAIVSVTSTGHAVVRHLEGIRGPNKIGNIRRAADLICRFNVGHIIVEELADGLFGETLENQLMLLGNPMAVEKVTTGGMQKGRRIIETLAPPMANGRIIMLQDVSQSDHGGDFTNQLVRISYDGRTGKAKDHDDIVDALAHTIAQCKGDLVSDISENIASNRADRLDDWRGISLRYGGLGVGGDPDELAGARAVAMGDPLGGGMSMGERLLEEDEVLTRYEAKLEHLIERYKTLARQNASPSQLRLVRKQIDTAQQVVKDLKEIHVL